MVDKAKELIPSFIMDGVKSISEPLGKAEKAIEKAREKLIARAGKKIDTKDVKKVFEDVKKQIQKARGEAENLVSDSFGRTMQVLNLPTRDEVDAIKADIAKLSKDLNSLKKPAAPKKAAPKKAAKKVGKKK